MRRRTILLFLLQVLCLLLLAYLLNSFRIKPIRPVQTFPSRKDWRLISRNELRTKNLFEKYRSLFDLTPLKTNSNPRKTMIYSCQSFCGGWGDRLRGILSAYVLALLSDRHFMIDMNYPCPISNVLEPNFVNWTYISFGSSNRTRLTINTMRSYETAYRDQIARTISSENFTQVWSSYDDIYLSTNSDYMRPALNNVYMTNKTRELFGSLSISQITMQNMFPLFYELLFKPANAVQKRVDLVLSSSLHRQLICFHIRIGKNPTNPYDHAFTKRVNTTEAMIDFTDKNFIPKNASLVFVTSDSGQAISDVLRHYSNSSMTVVGPILHIDRFDRRSSTVCEGFLKVLADFYVLGECQISLVSKSGFSNWATRRRSAPNEHLYIYNENIQQIRKTSFA